MDNPAADKAQLRTRDFWAALALIVLSLFFLWRTSFIPFLGENRAGVSGADWYNSAAIVPFGVWVAMLILSFVLLGSLASPSVMAGPSAPCPPQASAGTGPRRCASPASAS